MSSPFLLAEMSNRIAALELRCSQLESTVASLLAKKPAKDATLHLPTKAQDARAAG
jgi:uncharacterized small protein (DUF1192 family)